MKIALFLHDLRAGGAERVSVNLANAIVQLGHDVDLVLVNRLGCKAFFDELEASIRVLELPQSRTLTSAVGFRSYMMRERPNLVISALTHINVCALIGRHLSRYRPKITIVEHGQFSRERAKSMPVSVRMAYWMAPWLYPLANRIATVSKGAREDLARSTGIDPQLISVLHNPVVNESLTEASLVPIDHPWFEADEPPVILAVGALRSEKNFPLLIRAFNALRQHREARLVIIGDGPEMSKLIDCARSCRYAADIALLGFDANPYKYMRRAALLALSSDHEALPSVLIEAMACGTPVVATNCPTGPSEILLDGKLGALSATGDPIALADALERSLSAPPPSDLLIRRAACFLAKHAASNYLRFEGAVGSG